MAPVTAEQLQAIRERRGALNRRWAIDGVLCVIDEALSDREFTVREALDLGYSGTLFLRPLMHVGWLRPSLLRPEAHKSGEFFFGVGGVASISVIVYTRCAVFVDAPFDAPDDRMQHGDLLVHVRDIDAWRAEAERRYSTTTEVSP